MLYVIGVRVLFCLKKQLSTTAKFCFIRLWQDDFAGYVKCQLFGIAILRQDRPDAVRRSDSFEYMGPFNFRCDTQWDGDAACSVLVTPMRYQWCV